MPEFAASPSFSSDSFSAYDGTRLAYHSAGDGDPLVCLPGGPTDSAYLGDLGGLSAHRRVIRLDLRGTGRSQVPDDLATCRCDRLVDDVEALREHLGLDRVDLLAHCAGANPAVQYAALRPGRVRGMVLVTPSVRAVGIPIAGDLRLATARLRKDEPWYPTAYAALEAIAAGRGDDSHWEAVAPFSYGRWDDAARTHHAAAEERMNQMNQDVMAAFGADGAFAPDATRAALADFAPPVLLLAGEVDTGAPPAAVAEFAALFPAAGFVVQSGAGHHPWLDDPERFAAATAGFLA
ncbi:alpha/beta hydrolase [Streptomyces sp. NPDC046977]|uniref:alpha/beta fold hydrolase n=1 Tax=Streptomyces sp. NPDC046977 TaxID=3154703 RepID=UPI0033D39AC0